MMSRNLFRNEKGMPQESIRRVLLQQWNRIGGSRNRETLESSSVSMLVSSQL